MDLFLSREQAFQLNRVIEEANKSYLKQSRMSNQPCFNILRVLSALRLLHPDSPPNLYNAILFMTKNYNPQTLDQWQRAVSELLKMRNIPPKTYKNNVRPSQTSKYMKTYQNSFNNQRIASNHFQSRSHAHIVIPKEVSHSYEASFDQPSNKDISQTNAETGKRYYHTNTDSIVHESQHHYISFEPNHPSDSFPSYYEKQNVNSTNMGQSRKGQSSYQYIEAIKRGFGRTEKIELNKTPIDQSFIKRIDSYQSPYLQSVVNYQPVDPEEEFMNERAMEFLKINLTFKAFSSLIATTLALQKAKEYRNKAQTQKNGTLLQKSFESLKENVFFQQMVREKEAKSETHYNLKRKSKTFNILKLLFDLRKKTAPLNVAKLNSFSYEFVLALLLSVPDEQQSAQIAKIDFNEKIEELVMNSQIDKVCLIIKYFGRHSWTSETAVKRLIEDYKKSIMKRVFGALLQEKESNQKPFFKREKWIQKSAFDVMKTRWNKRVANQLKIMEFRGRQSRKLQSKVMRGFLQIVYSAKIYSKRGQYLTKKYNSKLKASFLSLWHQATQEKISRFSELKEGTKQALKHIVVFFQSIYFRKLLENKEQLCQKQNALYRYNLHSNFKILLFSSKNSQQQKAVAVENSNKQRRLMHIIALMRWKDSTKKGKGIKKMSMHIKAFYFRSVIAPVFKLAIEEMNIIDQKQYSTKKKVLEAIKEHVKVQEERRVFLCANVQRVIQTHAIKMFLNLLNRNYRQCLKVKQEQQIAFKVSELLDLQKRKKYSRSLSNLIKHKSKVTSEKQKMCSIRQKKKQEVLKQFAGHSKLQQGMRIRKLALMSSIGQARALYLTDCISENILQRKTNKVQIYRKTMILKQISQKAIQESNSNKEAQTKAQNHYQERLKQSVLRGLLELIEKRNLIAASFQEYCKRRMNSHCCQQLNQLRSQTKLRKLQTNISKKVTINRIQRLKNLSNKNQKIEAYIKQQKKKSFFVFLTGSVSKVSHKQSLEEQTKIFSKWLLLNRLKTSFIDSLIAKKYLYMAVKFRALKLSKIVFSCWKANKVRSNPPALKLKSQIPNMRKANDRLSTDFI